MSERPATPPDTSPEGPNSFGSDGVPRAAASPLSRRRLLQVSGAAGLALAGGSVFVMWGSSGHYRRLLPSGATPRVLSEKEMAILAAFCDRILPDAPGHLTARDARLADRIDRELTFHGRRMQSDLKAALLVLEHGGWLHASPTRFTKLASGEMDAYLARMADGGDLERQVFNGLRVLALFFYYCDQRTWPGIHYVGPLVSVRAPPEADSNPSAKGA